MQSNLDSTYQLVKGTFLFDTVKYTNSSSNAWEDTGITIDVPVVEHYTTVYTIQIRDLYNNALPSMIALRQFNHQHDRPTYPDEYASIRSATSMLNTQVIANGNLGSYNAYTSLAVFVLRSSVGENNIEVTTRIESYRNS